MRSKHAIVYADFQRLWLPSPAISATFSMRLSTSSLKEGLFNVSFQNPYNESYMYSFRGIRMKRMVRKNYLLPEEIAARLRSMVKSGRYATESELIRKSLLHMIDLEARRAEEISKELDELAEETAKHLPKGKTAGELVHEAHLEESHGS